MEVMPAIADRTSTLPSVESESAVRSTETGSSPLSEIDHRLFRIPAEILKKRGVIGYMVLPVPNPEGPLWITDISNGEFQVLDTQRLYADGQIRVAEDKPISIDKAIEKMLEVGQIGSHFYTSQIPEQFRFGNGVERYLEANGTQNFLSPIEIITLYGGDYLNSNANSNNEKRRFDSIARVLATDEWVAKRGLSSVPESEVSFWRSWATGAFGCVLPPGLQFIISSGDGTNMCLNTEVVKLEDSMKSNGETLKSQPYTAKRFRDQAVGFQNGLDQILTNGGFEGK
jgi:hypothetical protein